jgi:hypothetical protein
VARPALVTANKSRLDSHWITMAAHLAPLQVASSMRLSDLALVTLCGRCHWLFGRNPLQQTLTGRIVARSVGGFDQNRQQGGLPW